MSRQQICRNKIKQELWICQHLDCGHSVNVDDATLCAEVIAILTQMIDEPSLVKPRSIPFQDSPMEMGADSQNSQVDQEQNGFDFNQDTVRKAIFALAGDKYRDIDNRQFKAAIVNEEYEKSKLLSSLLFEVFKRTVMRIRLGDGIVQLRLKNHQIIGKESAPC